MQLSMRHYYSSMLCPYPRCSEFDASAGSFNTRYRALDPEMAYSYQGEGSREKALENVVIKVTDR